MTAQEVHINLELELQKINSNFERDIQPEELDFFLNKQMNQFIKNKLGPKAQIESKIEHDKSYKDKEDLQGLEITPLTFKALINNNKEVTALLNTDIFSLKAINTFVYCGDLPQVVKPHYKHEIKLNINDAYNDNFKDFKLFLNGDIILDFTVLFPFKAKVYSFEFIRVLVDTLRDMGFLVYYEYFKNVFLSKTLTIISYNDSDTFIFNYSGVVKTPTKVTLNYKVYDIEDYTSLDLRQNRVILNEYLYYKLTNPFSKSTYNSPISSYTNKTLNTYNDSGFINVGYSITYYKIPKSFDINLSQVPNLSDDVLYEIIANTARNIKAVIASNTYQAALSEQSQTI